MTVWLALLFDCYVERSAHIVIEFIAVTCFETNLFCVRSNEDCQMQCVEKKRTEKKVHMVHRYGLYATFEVHGR
jgi:hypothetical protein